MEASCIVIKRRSLVHPNLPTPFPFHIHIVYTENVCVCFCCSKNRHFPFHFMSFHSWLMMSESGEILDYERTLCTRPNMKITQRLRVLFVDYLYL